MTRFIAALAVAATLATTFGAAANAAGNARKETAQMGQITPHGVFDGR